jgi:hypothetical protein
MGQNYLKGRQCGSGAGLELNPKNPEGPHQKNTAKSSHFAKVTLPFVKGMPFDL